MCKRSNPNTLHRKSTESSNLIKTARRCGIIWMVSKTGLALYTDQMVPVVAAPALVVLGALRLYWLELTICVVAFPCLDRVAPT